MYVVVGSATAAERLKKMSERIVGFPAYVVHTPAAIHHGGCSYSVRLDDRALNDVKAILYDNGISFKGIYIEETEKGERVYHAVS